MTSVSRHQTFLDRALAEGHAEITGEGRNERILYVAADHSERWADPEEKVRAELWAELIGFEVNVPRRTPNDYADLVIFRDDEKKMPWFVIECKRGDLSDAAFDQAIEQACGNRVSLGAPYCGAVHTKLVIWSYSVSSSIGTIMPQTWEPHMRIERPCTRAGTPWDCPGFL